MGSSISGYSMKTKKKIEFHAEIWLMNAVNRHRNKIEKKYLNQIFTGLVNVGLKRTNPTVCYSCSTNNLQRKLQSQFTRFYRHGPPAITHDSQRTQRIQSDLQSSITKCIYFGGLIGLGSWWCCPLYCPPKGSCFCTYFWHSIIYVDVIITMNIKKMRWNQYKSYLWELVE